MYTLGTTFRAAEVTHEHGMHSDSWEVDQYTAATGPLVSTIIQTMHRAVTVLSLRRMKWSHW